MTGDYKPDIPEKAPHRVLIKRDVFVDKSREGRKVPVKIYHPVDHDHMDLPVVVWSHGLGGSREGAGFLNRFIAGNGYIVVNTQHPGTDSSLWEGKEGHPWDVIRAATIPERAVINRYRDIPFVLDQLPDWLGQHDDIVPADFSRLGMSGHSFGALTTQVMLGQTVVGENGSLTEMMDSRFQAGIVYSPVPVLDKKGHSDAEIYEQISRPCLYMTGTEDDSPIEGYSYKDRLEVFENAGGGDQYLMVLEGGDHMVFSGSRGKLGKNPKRGIHENLIKRISLAFWEAWLNGNQAAKHWLNSGLNDYVGNDAFTRHRDLGFF